MVTSTHLDKKLPYSNYLLKPIQKKQSQHNHSFRNIFNSDKNFSLRPARLRALSFARFNLLLCFCLLLGIVLFWCSSTQ